MIVAAAMAMMMSACVLAVVCLVLITRDRERGRGGGGSQRPPRTPGTPNASGGDDVRDGGPMPSWAQQGTVVGPTLGLYEGNQKTVADMDASGGHFDFLLYGDSITAFLTRNPATFKKHFGDKKAAALGVGGNTVEQLAWRIMSGQERPARAPKCVAFNIGVNNSMGDVSRTASRMETLLQWMRRAYPQTTLVLMALLPTSRAGLDVRGTNRLYSDLAKRLGIVYAECGQDMDPDDTSLYSDGLHPTAGGHDVVLKCLRKIVAPYI